MEIVLPAPFHMHNQDSENDSISHSSDDDDDEDDESESNHDGIEIIDQLNPNEMWEDVSSDDPINPHAAPEEEEYSVDEDNSDEDDEDDEENREHNRFDSELDEEGEEFLNLFEGFPDGMPAPGMPFTFQTAARGAGGARPRTTRPQMIQHPDNPAVQIQV